MERKTGIERLHHIAHAPKAPPAGAFLRPEAGHIAADAANYVNALSICSKRHL